MSSVGKSVLLQIGERPGPFLLSVAKPDFRFSGQQNLPCPVVSINSQQLTPLRIQSDKKGEMMQKSLKMIF